MEGVCDVLFFKHETTLLAPGTDVVVETTSTKETYESATMAWRQDASMDGLRIRLSNFKTFSYDSDVGTDVTPKNLSLEFLVSSTGGFVQVTDASHALAQAFLALSKDKGWQAKSSSMTQTDMRSEVTRNTESMLRDFWRCVVENWCGLVAPRDTIEIRASRLRCVGSVFLSSTFEGRSKREMPVDERALNDLDESIVATYRAFGHSLPLPADLAINVESVQMVERLRVDAVEDCLIPVLCDDTVTRTTNLVGSGVTDARFVQVSARGWGFLHPEVLRAGMVLEFRDRAASSIRFARSLCKP